MTAPRAAHHVAAFLFVLLAIFGVGSTTASAATQAQKDANREQVCRLWNESPSNPEVTIAQGFTVSGSRLTRVGADCQATNATIKISDAQVQAPAAGSPTGTAAARLLAAVTHAAESGEITQGTELFSSASISRIEVGFDINTGFYVTGELRLAWSGGTNSYFTFRGTILALDAFDFSLVSPAAGTVLPNLGGSPLRLSGTLKLRQGHYDLNLTGMANSLVIGEGAQKITVTRAALKLNLRDDADGKQRLSMSASGKIQYGDNVTVDGSVALEFDDQGLNTVKGGGDLAVTIPASGSSPEGQVTGSADISYGRGEAPLITFVGEARFGEAVIVGAKGTVDLAAVNFTGDATVKYNDILFTGAVEGVVFIGLDLAGNTITDRAGQQVQAKNSEWLIKSATANVTAKGFVAKGVAQVGNVGGERWIKAKGDVNGVYTAPGIADTTLKGEAGIDWLEGAEPKVDFAGSVESGSTFVANAKGSADGKKLDFAGDVSLDNPDLKITGAVDGTFFYGENLAGSTIKNKAGDDVAATKGDFYLKTLKGSVDAKGFVLTGAATLGRVGETRWAKGTGTVAGSYNTTRVNGSATLDWSSPAVPTVTYKASVSYSAAGKGQIAVADAEGTVDGNKFTVKGTGKFNVNGLVIDGTADGVVYFGSDLTGEKITDRAGNVVKPNRGDFAVKVTAASVVTNGFSVKGSATVSRTGGIIWARGGGDVDLAFGDTKLKGSITADWTLNKPVAVGFSGTVSNGTSIVAGATGTFDGKKLIVKGNASFTDPKFALSGAVEGVVYYGDDLTGETVANRAGTQVPAKKGDFLVKSNASGEVAIKDLKLTGVVSVSSVGGVLWATGGGTVDLNVDGTKIKGAATLAWAAGETPAVAFEGSVSSGDTEIGKVKGTIDSAKVTFTGEAKLTNALLTATGTVTEGVVYYGNDLTGLKVTNRAGDQVQAVKGDLFLKLGATAQLNTQSFKVTGAATVGRTAGELWVKGSGAADLSAGTTSVKGWATIEWISGKSPAVTFEGSVSQGDLKVASVKGTLDDKKLTFTGEAALDLAGYATKGAAEGIVYFGNDLSGETVKNRAGAKVPATKGDVVITSAKASVAAKGLTLSGDASISYVGGKLFADGSGAVDFTSGETNVKGSATATWALGEQAIVAFKGTVTQGTIAVGNVVGTLDGKKLSVKGDAKITDPKFTVTGSAEGIVYYGDDLTGETVKNKAGATVAAKKGDFVVSDASAKISAKGLDLTGKLTIGSVGGEVWATVGGAVDLTYGEANIKGSATLEWTPGIDPVVTFAGALKLGDVEVGSVSGTADGKKISFNGKAAYKNATVAIDGNVSGVVFYGSDLSSEKIKNKAGTDVTPNRGDFVVTGDAAAKVSAYNVTLGGKVAITGVGTDRWVSAQGTLDVVYGQFTVKGSATIDWTIGSPFPAIPFTGSVKSADVDIASVKGTITDKAIDFSGTAGISNAQLAVTGAVEGKLFWAADQTGQKVKNYAGAEIQPKQYDLFVKSASAKVDAKGFTLTGAVEIGVVGGEKWVKGGGSVDATFGSTTIKGAASVDYLFGGIAKLTFSGSLSNGTTFVGNASGSIDGKKISVKGDAKVTDPKFSVTGSVEGAFYYGDDLTGETVKNKAGADVAAKKGDFVLADASTKITAAGLELTGKLTLSSVGGELWATAGGTVDLTYGSANIKGSATLAWAPGSDPVVTFTGALKLGDAEIGSVSGTADGKKIAFTGKASYTNATVALSGAVTGVVYYGSDLSGEKIKNRAGAEVTPARGDFSVTADASGKVVAYGITLTGKAGISGVGSEKWITGGGAVDATYGAYSVKGTASVDWVIGSAFPSIPFTGSVKSADVEIASVKGTINDKVIDFAGTAGLSNAQLSLSGAVEGKLHYAADQTGQKVKNYAGADVQAKQFDLFIKSASAKVVAKGVTVTGDAEVGLVGSEKWVKGGGTLDATFGSTSVKGSATVDYLFGGVAKVTFAGSLSNGTTLVGKASGSIDGKRIAITGDVVVTDPNFSLKGAAEGVVYYGDDLTGETVKNRAGASVKPAKGDFFLTSASGEVVAKSLTLKGAATFSSLGTEKWATGNGEVNLTTNGLTLKGKASADWVVGQSPTVVFEGSVSSGDTEIAGAKGTVDGKKIVFSASAQGNATIANTALTLKGAVSGTVYYGADQTGEKVKNKAGTEVDAKQGDFVIDSASATVTVKGLTLVGKATAGKVDGVTWVTAGGTVDFTYNGTTIKGSATVDWTLGKEPVVTYQGTVARDGVTFAGVRGTLDSTKLTFDAGADLSVSGIAFKGQTTGVVYLGSDLTGQKIRNAAGDDVTPARGDVFVDSAAAQITAKGVTVNAVAQLGFVGGKLWVQGAGNLAATFGTTKIDGAAAISWAQGAAPTVTFVGSVTNGTTLVANAAGSLDGKKIAVKGNASLTDPKFTLKGAAEGVVFYGDDLTGETIKDQKGQDVQPAKGDFSIISASGEAVVQNLTLKGEVAFTSLGTTKWATGGGTVDLSTGGYTLKGSATANWVVGQSPQVKFTGSFKSGDTEIASASGELDGKKIAITGAAKVTSANLTVEGSASGVVHYAADQTGETVKNKSGATVAAKQGDFLITSATAKVTAKGFVLTGAASAGRVGTVAWVTGGGNVDLTYGTINVKGSAKVEWIVGFSPVLSFEGSLKNSDVEIGSAKGTIDDKKITFSGTAKISTGDVKVDGSVTGGVLYYGNSLTGETIKNKAGVAVQATKGDLRIDSAAADVTVKNLTFKANVEIGIVGATKWAKGTGSVDATFGSTKLSGSADFDWTIGTTPSVAFTGGIANGTAVVANAAGTLDGKKIALKGNVTATTSNLTVKGAVDGVFFYGADQTGELVANRAGVKVQPLQGDYLLTNASGSVDAKGLSLSGGISVGNVRGDWWATAGGSIDLSFGQPVTRIQGTATMKADGNVAFEGKLTNADTTATVSGTADGKKITFTGALSNPMLSGNASGYVYYGENLAGETVVNRAGQTVAATRGDFKVDVTNGSLVLKQLTVANAQASLVKAGTAIWIKGGGKIKIAQTWITFTGEADNTGYANLTGSGTVNFDGTTVDFSGTATIKNNALTIGGTVKVTNGLLSATLTGTIEKPNMEVSQYVFTGTANFKFGSFSVANASVKLIFGEGLITTFDIKSCFVIFICPNATYKLYFTGTQVSRVEINAPVAWVAQFTAIAAIAAPGAQIAPKITGII